MRCVIQLEGVKFAYNDAKCCVLNFSEMCNSTSGCEDANCCVLRVQNSST